MLRSNQPHRSDGRGGEKRGTVQEVRQGPRQCSLHTQKKESQEDMPSAEEMPVKLKS